MLRHLKGYLSENRGAASFVHPFVTSDGAARIEELCAAGGISIRGTGRITRVLLG
jgi:hypothetical protein